LTTAPSAARIRLASFNLAVPLVLPKSTNVPRECRRFCNRLSKLLGFRAYALFPRLFLAPSWGLLSALVHVSSLQYCGYFCKPLCKLFKPSLLFLFTGFYGQDPSRPQTATFSPADGPTKVSAPARPPSASIRACKIFTGRGSLRSLTDSYEFTLPA
jgi:hypothetical protein